MYNGGYLKQRIYGAGLYLKNLLYKAGRAIGINIPCINKALSFYNVELNSTDKTCFYEENSSTVTDDERDRISVIEKRIVGNNSLFGQIRYEDGTDFTDADLPTNYSIEYNGKYSEQLNTGFFGFDSTNYHFRSSFTLLGQFVFAFFGQFKVMNTPLTIGDDINIKLVVTNSNLVEVFINEISYGTVTATVSTLNKIIQVLTIGDGSTHSAHTCDSFTITNTDTDEVIMNFKQWSQIQDDTDNNQSYVLDDTSKFLCYFSNTYSGYTEESVQLQSISDEIGVSYAIRNEVDNYDLESSLTSDDSGTQFSYRPTGGLLFGTIYSTSFQVFNITEGHKYFTSIEITSDSTGQIHSTARLRYTDNTEDAIGDSTDTDLYFGIITATKSGLANLKFREGTAGTITNKEVFLYDLTEIDKTLGTSYATMTASEINDIKYDLLALEIYRTSDGDRNNIYETGQFVGALQNADGNYSTEFCKGYNKDGNNFPLTYNTPIKPLFHSNSGSFTSNGTDNELDAIAVNEETIVEILGQFVSLPTGAERDRIGVENTTSGDYRFWFGATPTSWQVAFGDVFPTGGVPDTDIHIFKLMKNGFYIDDKLIIPINYTNFDSDITNFNLFARRVSSGLTNQSNFKNYKSTIISNGQTHIWDFGKDSERVEYTIDGILQTDPTIQGTVLSSQWSSDNITYPKYVYPTFAPKDNNEIFYENITADIPDYKIVENITGNIYDGVEVTDDENGNPIEICISSDYTLDGIEDGVLIDQLGETTHDVIVPKAMDGNGSLYGEVRNGDGIDFTDADLPTNYEIAWKGVYNFASDFGGFWGFELFTGGKAYSIRSDNILGRFTFYCYNIGFTENISIASGDKAEVIVTVNGSNVVCTINGIEIYNGSFVKNVGNNNLEILTAGSTGNKSNHDCHQFKITNTDTDEVIMNFNNFAQVTDPTSNNQSVVADATGNYLMYAFNTYSDWVKEDYRVEADCEENGVSIAIRNEVDNYDFSDGTSGWMMNNSILSVVNNVLLCTSDGTSTVPRMSTNANLLQNTGDKTFCFAKVRVTNPDCTRIDLGGSSNIFVVNSPIVNEWYDLYGFEESSTIDSMFIKHRYVDTATSNGKVMEVDGNISTGGGVFALNLTAIDNALGTSYASMTAEEINAIKYDLLALQRYKDESLTLLYDTGQPIQNLEGNNSLSSAWVSDGQGGSEHPSAEFVGTNKVNLRAVDGVVDNGVDYGNWSVTSGPDNIVFSNNGISFEAQNTTDTNLQVDTNNLKDATTYTIVLNTSNFNLTTTSLFILDNQASSETKNLGVVSGEKRVTFLTDSSIANQILTFRFLGITAGDSADILITIYEGDYVTGSPPLPTSGQFVEGNSIVATDNKGIPYPRLIKVDETDISSGGAGTRYWYDYTNYDSDGEVETKVIPIADIPAEVGDQHFFTKDLNGNLIKSGIYQFPLQEPCLSEAQNFFNVHIPYKIYNDVTGEYDSYVTNGLQYNVKAGS